MTTTLRRAFALGAGALTALTLAAAGASPASAADPVTSYTSSHGRLVTTVYNPADRSQFVQIAVDAHFGYVGAPDATADYVSPVGRISKGNGAVRVEVDRLRTGADDGSFVQDDYRIAANAGARDNGLLPALPLNSGPASQALGYGDWRAVPKCGGPLVAVRVDTSVRWANGSVTHPTLRSNYVQPNGTSCAPADTTIHAVSPFRALDTGDTTPDTAGCQWTADAPATTSAHSRIVSATTADATWSAGEQASVCGTSIETTNLGVTLAAGDVVSVDYALLDGASAAAGSVRLFVDCSGTLLVATAPATSTGGTLSVTAPAGGCTVGAVGLVYDTSNGGVAGRVRFTGLDINGTPVSFL